MDKTPSRDLRVFDFEIRSLRLRDARSLEIDGVSLKAAGSQPTEGTGIIVVSPEDNNDVRS